MARYRKVRVDLWSHPKTMGLTSHARDVMLQAVCANILGALELPLARIARRCACSTKQVQSAISELTDRGIARWWPDESILWVVEAFDEQASAKSPQCIVAATTTAMTLPPEVRLAVEERYGLGVSVGVSDRVSGDLENTLVENPESEQEQGQEQGQDIKSAKPDSVSDLWSYFNERRTATIRGAKPVTLTSDRRAAVRRLLKAGHTPEDVRHVIDHYARGDAQWFNASTPFRPENFARALSTPAPQTTRKRTEPQRVQIPGLDDG